MWEGSSRGARWLRCSALLESSDAALLGRPFRARMSLLGNPRALPWAAIGRPVGTPSGRTTNLRCISAKAEATFSDLRSPVSSFLLRSLGYGGQVILHPFRIPPSSVFSFQLSVLQPLTSICNLLSATVPRPDGTGLLGRFGGFLFKVFAGDLAGDGDDVVAGFHAEQGNGVFLA